MPTGSRLSALHITFQVSGFTRRALRFTFYVFLALLTLAGASAARAQGTSQQTAIAVSARAGYGDTGAYLIGEWLPVRVTLDNPAGGTSRHVRVQVTSKGSDDSITAGLYALDLDLPASSHKEVTLYAYSGSYTRKFVVSVMDGSTVLANVNAAAEPFEPPANIIIGVISSDQSLLNVLKGEQVGHIVNSLQAGGYGGYSGSVHYVTTGPGSSTVIYQSGGAGPIANSGANGTATIAHITLSDIPTLSQALDDLGAIVVDDVDTGPLSPEQRAALDGWVSRGGMLIVASRPGGADVTAGLSDLLPVTVGGSSTIASLDSLRDLVGATAAPAGAASGAESTVRPEVASTSRVLAQQDGVPLVVERDLGLGNIAYMAISPGVAPLKGWDGTLPLMKRVLADHASRMSYGDFLRFSPSRGYYSGSLFDTYGGMFAIPGLDLPDPMLIGLFLLLYIIIIGPVNFIILRRMRRAELAWITVPALVLLFSVVAYALAFQSKGGDLVAIRANVANTYAGVDQATMAQHYGLFSPVRRTYTLSLPAGSAVTEINAFGYYQPGSDTPSAVLGGNTTTIDNVNIDTWSLKAFVAEHTQKAHAPVETHLALGDNAIVGTVKNITNGPVQDVALVRGDAVHYIGYLAPGAQQNVRLDVSSGRFDTSSPARLIPAPPGVNPPSPGAVYLSGGSQGNAAAQRVYDRKIELLSAGLYPLVADQAPADFNVIVLAWGPPLPANFEVEGHTTSTDELNLWADVVPVSSPVANEQPALRAGLVPYTVYAPGNNPTLLVWNGSGPLSSSVSPGLPPTSVPGIVPTAAPGVPIPPVPIPYVPGGVASVQTIHISPYADIHFRLPAGIKPATLSLTYTIGQSTAAGDMDLLAYNVSKGNWDKVGAVQVGSASQSAHLNGTISINNPPAYTGAGGDVIVRLQPKAGDTTLTDVTLNLELNAK
jgi:hypothetical protein